MSKDSMSTITECLGCFSAILGSVGGIGSVIAIVLSYSINKSILWALAHGLLGWLYVIYHTIYK